MSYKIILLLICLMGAYGASAQFFNVQASPYNATGNGKTDDRDAIVKAINAAHEWSQAHSNAPSTLYFPAPSVCYLIGSYQINPVGNRKHNYAFYTYSNLKFRGDSITGTSTIKFKDRLFSKPDSTSADLNNGTGIYSNANMFYGKNEANITFKNLTVDLNGIHNVLPTGQVSANNATGRIKTIYGIEIEGGNYVSIDSVTMLNNPGRDDIIMEAPGNNLTIRNCLFKNGGRNVGSLNIQNINSTDFSFVYSEWGNSIFENNRFVQDYPEISLQEGSFSGGIEIHGSNSVMSGNYIFGCKPAVYVASNTSLAKGLSKGNNQLENIQIKSNRMIDCFGGVTLWVKNPLNGVTISGNIITTMFMKKAVLTPKQKPGLYHVVSGILYGGGNLPCSSNYKNVATGDDKSNLNSIDNLTIANNNISFDTASAQANDNDLTTTGISLHSVHNSKIENNTIKNMNWSGISLQGSPWGTKNLSISGNVISGFQHIYNANVAGYIVVTDTYLPNSDCNPTHEQTFSNINITGNTFTSNDVTIAESSCQGRGRACFKGMYFDLPYWYAYNTMPARPYTLNILKIGTFTISNTYSNPGELNYYVTSDCSTKINLCGNAKAPLH